MSSTTKRGFSLIHAMIYCTISTALLGLLFQFSIRIQEHIRTIHDTTSALMQLYTAYDFLRHDSQQIIPDDLVCCKNDALIFHQNDKQIGWQCHEGVLTRWEQKKEHGRKSKGVIATNITQFVSTYEPPLFSLTLEAQIGGTPHLLTITKNIPKGTA